MFFTFNLRSFIAVGGLSVALCFGLISCDKNCLDASDMVEIADDADEDNAPTDAVDPANALYYRFIANLPCSGNTGIQIYYREGVQGSFPALLTDSVRKLSPKGTWKSFTVKPELLGKAVAKKWDKTKSYTIYVRNTSLKKMQWVNTLTPNPTPFIATYKAAYTADFVEVNCTDFEW